MNEPGTDELEGWWLARLEPPPDETNLPLDRARSKIFSAKRSRVRLELPARLTAAVEAARQGDEEAYGRWLAGLFAVLYRYSGDHTGAERPVVGIPLPAVAGSDQALPVIVDGVGPALTFARLTAAVRAAVRATRAHAAMPWPTLVERLGHAEVLNRNQVFDIVFVIEGMSEPSGGGTVPAALRHDIEVRLGSAGLETGSLEIDYSARLFRVDTIERFAGHLLTLLGAALRAPQTELPDLDLLRADERRQLLETWNQTAADYPADRCLHQLFEAVAEAQPDAEALVFEQRSWSYAEVNAQANRLAHFLRSQGCERHARVGLSLRATDVSLIAVLAILKAGAAVVTLDATFPAYRLELILRNSGLTVAVTESALLERLPAGGYTAFCYDRLGSELDEQPDSNPTVGSEPTDLLYLLYTSGSTGFPKGVCMEHRSVVNLVSWQLRHGAATTTARTLHRTSLGFDVSFQEVFSTWAGGGTVVVASDQVRADISLLPAFFAQYRIERAFLPFVSLQQLAETFAVQNHRLETLKEIITAGERLQITMPLVRFFRQVECRLDNQYGPTETHVVTSYRLQGPCTRWPTLPPIGRPLSNVSAYILDTRLRPVPVGVVGEICIGGVAVARGYSGLEDGPDSPFQPDPYRGEPKARLYRTGDLGRFLPDGEIEFLGRRDQQVKIRGYRVEMGEIEVALRDIAGVREATVTAREDLSGTQALVAYIVTEAPDVPPLVAIRRSLHERLPEHMVPTAAAFVRLNKLPLTATGKVDVARLPEPGQERPELSESYLASRSSLEQRIATIWSKTLGVGQVGVQDKFLDLGGHSLLGVQIVSQINELYGITVRLSSLMNQATVASLAQEVERLLLARVEDMSEEEALQLAKGETAEGSKPAAAMPATATSELYELPGGRRVADQYRAETRHLIVDIFEHKTYDRHGIVYPEEGCYFDVGANIGLFALYALERAPQARIFAFEPAPPLFELLRRNLDGAGQVRFFDYGLSDQAGEASLTFYPQLPGMSSFAADKDEERALLGAILRNQAERGEEGMAQVMSDADALIENRLNSEIFPARRLRTLSEVLAETGVDTVDLLKIDVQKTELKVLQGLAGADWPKIRQVVVEVHDQNGRLGQVEALLRRQGYRTTTDQDSLHTGSVVHFVYATRA